MCVHNEIPSSIAMQIVALQAEFSVQVGGSKGNVYTVRHNSTSGWSCTCPHFKYREVECKHIKHVKEDTDAGTDTSVSGKVSGGTDSELFPQEDMGAYDAISE